MINLKYPPENPFGSEQEKESLLISSFAPHEAKRIGQALKLATSVENQPTFRPQGIDVATILKRLDVDAETVEATLLSDSRLTQSLKQSFLEQNFGTSVANLVKNVHWLNTFSTYSKDVLDAPEQKEILRQMLLAMVDDVRAVVIKLGFRVQRMRNLWKEDPETRHHISRETLDIYAPLANRLGIGQLKWELEDLAFRVLEPVEYKKLAATLAERRDERESYLGEFIDRLRSLLKKAKIEAEVDGRVKHIYSIWRKMHLKQLRFDQLYDIRAVRVQVGKLAACYEVLGLVHSKWQYIPKAFDDYIANPKSNGYQSLHTVVAGSQGAVVEIQIRTQEMHRFAELGVAAHWRYKEGGKVDVAVEKSIASLRNLLKERNNSDRMLQDFRTDLYSDRIFVLTPKGELKNLMKGATPLDFAYAIHTEVGHHCRGSKVNGRIAPLSYQLKSGDQVEILTAKQGGPNRNWIDPSTGYVKTPRTMTKIRAWFRQQDHDRNLQNGKTILETLRKRLEVHELNFNDLMNYFHASTREELLIRLGRGDIHSTQLAGALDLRELPKFAPPIRVRKSKQQSTPDSIKVSGIGNMLTSFARCCKPVPGDAILGYITLGKGVTIHQRECSNIVSLTPEKHRRLINVEWGDQTESFPVKIHIDAIDRKGLLSHITKILANSHVNILDINSHTDRHDVSVHIILIIEVRNTEHLSEILSRIHQLQNVTDARRQH